MLNTTQVCIQELLKARKLCSDVPTHRLPTASLQPSCNPSLALPQHVPAALCLVTIWGVGPRYAHFCGGNVWNVRALRARVQFSLSRAAGRLGTWRRAHRLHHEVLHHTCLAWWCTLYVSTSKSQRSASDPATSLLPCTTLFSYFQPSCDSIRSQSCAG